MSALEKIQNTFASAAVRSIGCASLLLLTASGSVLAQQPLAPIPAQLITAQTVFVSNAGGPNSFHGQLAYNDLYNALLTYKRFQLVMKPADAELSFAISLSTVTANLSSLASGTPTVRLEVRDIKTQTLLWTFSEPVNGNATENYLAAAVQQLVADLESLLRGVPVRPPDTKKSRFQQDKQ